jgi:Domain of unknown function (DUF3303)
MLFLVSYRERSRWSEDDDKRTLKLFAGWKPPAGLQVKSHYGRGDGGGFLIVEAESAAAMMESNAPWIAFFEFEVVPIVEIAEAVPILNKVYAWRDSVR